MPNSLSDSIFNQLESLVLVDPHSHINPLAAPSRTLADLLGYHYYTELAHAAGMSKELIEPSDGKAVDPKEKVHQLIKHIGPLDNTVQWSWMLDLCRSLFDWKEDGIDLSNWERLYDQVERICKKSTWESEVLQRSKVASIFLTNDFDDPLEGFDTQRYIPCLRTDDLVFHLAKPIVRQRLEKSTKVAPTNLDGVRRAIGVLFERFVGRKAKACAISLPPDFSPEPISDASAESAYIRILQLSDPGQDIESRTTLSKWVFWTLATYCREMSLPFDLMIGVNRQVYPKGVFQGQDLYDSRVSLIQYGKLFNAFPTVKFPISVLASVTNQELVDYAWIFPNVFTNGHWWYSNTPSIIEHDLRARLEAIPRNKQIGYYSDAYKLEFILPKFRMYRRILANVLATDFAGSRGWSESRCIELGTQILRGNVDQIFC